MLWFTVSALFITLALCDNQARNRRPAARSRSHPQSKRPLAPMHAAVAAAEAEAATTATAGAGARASSAPTPRRRPNRDENGDDASDSSGDAEAAAPRRGADLEALRRELEQEQRRESSGHEARSTSLRDADSLSDRGSERGRARQDASHLASPSNGPQALPAWAPKGRLARANTEKGRRRRRLTHRRSATAGGAAQVHARAALRYRDRGCVGARDSASAGARSRCVVCRNARAAPLGERQTPRAAQRRGNRARCAKLCARQRALRCVLTLPQFKI